MTAIIDGVTVIGKPEEINELINLRNQKNKSNFPNEYTTSLPDDIQDWKYDTINVRSDDGTLLGTYYEEGPVNGVIKIHHPDNVICV